MQIEPIPGEPFRFTVPSDTGDGGYTVCLTDCNYNGSCACPYFEHRCYREWQDTQEIAEKTRCKHIKRALYIWTMRSLQEANELHTWFSIHDKSRLETINQAYKEAQEGYASLPERIKNEQLFNS